MATKKCSTPECDGKVKALGKCGACHARMYYWNDRPLRDKVEHAKKLRIRERTMEEMTNVTHISKGKRKRA